MKFSEKLHTGVEDLWREAAGKPFVREMALGTLTEKRFRNYMIQDYLYLLDYIEILSFIRSQTEDESLREFLLSVIKETENETYRVHIPHMRKIGVSDAEIEEAVRVPVISEYTGYMREQTREHGVLAGLTALLQCSWLYAYIGEKMTAEHSEEIAVSPYRFWIDAYTCKEYTDANRMWIDVLDRETEGINSDTAMLLKKIFRKCAEYENTLWDALYE